MLALRRLVARSFDLDHYDLFWDLQDTSEEIDLYDLFVLRSVDGPGGPFGVLSGPLRNTYMFRDPSADRLNNWRKHFYKVRVVHRETGDQLEFGPEWLRAEPDLIALEIQRRHELLLREFNGRPVILFPAITGGQRCPSCWDRGPKGNTLGRQKTQNCATCFDTTFVGGFSTPLRIWMQIDPSPNVLQRTETIELSANETTARCGAFPPLKPRDMIVEAENTRWRIERVTPTMKLRATVHQEIVIHELPLSSVRYKVPVKEDLLSRFGPEREYTRPMSLQGGEGSVLDDLFGAPR